MLPYKNIDESIQSQLAAVIKKNTTREIIAGKNYIAVTGKVMDEEDILYGVDAALMAGLRRAVLPIRSNTSLPNILARIKRCW
jgi:hypothetical protein